MRQPTRFCVVLFSLAAPAAAADLPLPNIVWTVPQERRAAVMDAVALLLQHCPHIAQVASDISETGIEYRDQVALRLMDPRAAPHSVMISLGFPHAPAAAVDAWTWTGEVAWLHLEDGLKPGIRTFKQSGRWLCGLPQAAAGADSDAFLPAALPELGPPAPPAGQARATCRWP